MSSTRRIRQCLAAALVATATVAGAAACGDDEPVRQTNTSSAASTTAAPLPTGAELTALMDKASDPNIPADQKLGLVQGGEEAPELFDQISKLKQEKNATVQIDDGVEGDLPDTLMANAIIRQPEQQDINVQAKFVKEGDTWKLQKSFACALITNAGLEAPASCAGQ